MLNQGKPYYWDGDSGVSHDLIVRYTKAYEYVLQSNVTHSCVYSENNVSNMMRLIRVHLKGTLHHVFWLKYISDYRRIQLCYICFDFCCFVITQRVILLNVNATTTATMHTRNDAIKNVQLNLSFIPTYIKWNSIKSNTSNYCENAFYCL